MSLSSSRRRGERRAKRRGSSRPNYENLYNGEERERRYYNNGSTTGYGDYNYVYHESSYDDSFWWIVFGIFAFFIFFIFVAAIASYHTHPDDYCCDDDDGVAPIVRETQRAIEEDPTESKKSEAFKILKNSLKDRGKVNRKGQHSNGDGKSQCPSGMVKSKGGQYAFISTSNCLPNYTAPMAVDASIIKGYNRENGMLEISWDRNERCTSFASFACSGWKGTGSRSFTYSSITNEKVLRMVENLDAIGDHLHWNPESGVKKIDEKEGEGDKHDNVEENGHETIASEREVFSAYIQKCHSTLDEIPAQIEQVKHHEILTEMIHAVFSFEEFDWEQLGSAYGVSACMGVNPLFHLRTETDLFDNSEPLFYIQPKGFVGLETNVRKRSIYIHEACKHIQEYTEEAGIKLPEDFVTPCYYSVESLEKQLSKALNSALNENDRNSKDDSFERYISKFELEGDSSTKDVDMRKLISNDSPFFSGDFFRGFMKKLTQCTLGESSEIIPEDKMFVWTEYSKYFDSLSEMISSDPSKKEEMFKSFRMMLVTSLAVDNLEVIGFFAASDYDHVVGGGSIIEEPLKPSKIAGKKSDDEIHNREDFIGSPEHQFLSRGFVPYNSNFMESTPRIIRLNGDRKHSIIRKKNLKKISVDSTKKERDETSFGGEPFSLSGSADWTNYAWFTCIDIAQTYFPEIVDNSFASFTTSVEDRAKVAKLTDSLLDSLVEDMQSSDMLDETTKDALTEKTQNILKRIAVPWESSTTAELEEQYRLNKNPVTRYPVPIDHSEIGIKGKDFYEDTILIRRWAIRQEMKDYIDRINSGGEIKRNGLKSLHFSMKTSETNAYYSPLENNINILSGIMKPPFFHKDYTKVSLYATMGSIVGHELSHSLDKTGVLFDKYGNLNVSMLSSDARAQYENREQCFVEQYKKYKTTLGNTVDSEKTLSENIADNAGIQASWDALRKRLKQEDGFSFSNNPEGLTQIAKEFTLSYAQMWCTNRGPDEEKFVMSIDVHSPPQIRIDRTLSNLIDKETGRYVMDIGWGCEEKHKMINKPRCAVF